MADKRPDMTRRPSAGRPDPAVDDWVRGGDHASAPPAPTAVSPAPPAPREPTRRLTLDIPERLHFAMKMHASATGVTMVDEVRAVLEAHYAEAVQRYGALRG